jgi:threonine/homoserine/homoserine lactone efflux protein
VLRALVAFAPVAALLTVTPGAATAMVVRSAVSGGRRRALATTIGNSLGVWYSTLAYLVARARRAFVEGPWLARVERVTGAVLVGLGVRLAFEQR